jgi:hypothetical protein
MFDLLAWIPIGYVVRGLQQIRIFRLLKLLRLPRLQQLLDVNKFKTSTTNFHKRNLIKAVESENYSYNYPI